MNKFLKVMFFLLTIVGLEIANPTPVSAATTPNDRVLLVYDSQNDVQEDKKNIDTLQRSLTSMNLRVKTVEQSQYKKNMLSDKYIGVITMINWRQVGLINQDFVADRDKFTGIRLHIGENLTQTEIDQLGVKVTKIYQQQLILKNNNNKESLPFSNSITVITDAAKDSQSVGTLMTQQAGAKTYPFGYINGKNGYLPYFSNDGLSLMTQVEMIGKLFGRVGKYQPLLTITKVTPYSNLKRLDELSRYCYKNEIPFAVSTVSVSDNTEMKAFNRFTSTLRNVESRGGIIFLQTPEVSSNADTEGTVLEQTFLTYIVSLARHQVFPVGISSAGFWNQDKILRSNSLTYADHWLLLPNGQKVTYVKQDNDSQIAKQSFFAMSATSLNNVKKNSETNFSIPTALTIDMPYSKKALDQVENEIKNLNLSWYDPVNDNLQTVIQTDTTNLEYKYGNYFANGKAEDIQVTNSAYKHQFSDGRPQSLFSDYFKIQGNILAVFFVVIMIILLIFIFLGQRIYWNRFKR